MVVDYAMSSQSVDAYEDWGSDRPGTARKTKRARKLRTAAKRLSFAC